MSDNYQLPVRFSAKSLAVLNSSKIKLVDKCRLLSTPGIEISDEDLWNTLLAIKSGKKIVDPPSPKDEFQDKYNQLQKNSDHDSKEKIAGINYAIDMIAKIDPNYKQWIGEKLKI